MDNSLIPAKRSAVSVGGIGLSTPHDPGWACNRPQGSGDWLVMCFSTPFIALTKTGRRRGEPGDCLINSPDFPNWHSSVPGAIEGFRNDWIHFSSPLLPVLLAHYKLPVNTIFPTGDAMVITAPIEEFRREQEHAEAFAADVGRCQVELLLLRLARARRLMDARLGLSPSERIWRPRFQQFRAHLRENSAEPWQVTGMAARLNLSPNRFNVLYRRFFNVSPQEDLIRMRIERAKTQLAHSSAPITAVAEDCGFSSVFYFCRLFRQRVGVTPGAFARCHGVRG